MKDPKHKFSKTKVGAGVAYVHTTFNNTIISVTTNNGKVLFWSSSGKQGFQGFRKATPFSAQVVGESIGATARSYGINSLHIKVNGPGLGRESAIRALYNCGIKISAIEDTTAVPHNGCKPPKRRRV